MYKELIKPELKGHYSDPQYADVDVAIVMESTYPYLKGGVSAVVHDIVTENPDLSFGIIHIAWDSNSPQEDLYGMPKNVSWVKTVYLSMEEHREGFTNVNPRELNMKSPARKALANRIVDALLALQEDGDPNPLWTLYDEGFNPRTRQYPLWALLGTREFMEVVRDRLHLEDMSFSDIFWNMRTFFSLAYALLHENMPHARVYHAHTTGYAALISAAAARDHGAGFLLTEHNLYIRDTVNTMLDRNMALTVQVSDYETFEVTPEQRSWMMWLIEMGRFCYPSADAITYLYPKALEEARLLDAPVEDKAIVLPNGMLVSDVNEAYAQRRIARQQIDEVGDKHFWKFVFIARVVPIKGLIDLIETVNMLRQEGITNFHCDILGPTHHTPEYYTECRERIAELALEDFFTFHGTVNVRDMLGGFDALLMPSYNEGQPIVALEAMSASIPLIGSDVGGMSQLLDDVLVTSEGEKVGRCGVLTQPGDPAGFAHAMKELMGSVETYERMCVNARERVVQFFQLHDVMNRYNVLYRSIGGMEVSDITGKLRIAIAQQDTELIAELIEESTKQLTA